MFFSENGRGFKDTLHNLIHKPYNQDTWFGDIWFDIVMLFWGYLGLSVMSGLVWFDSGG
jgi:hypothetical protein